ncbi:unnamed protein product, partial [Laminaria digitata]
KKLALSWLELRNACPLYSPMWTMANLGLLHTVGRLEIDDTPTRIVRRDMSRRFSYQDSIKFFRFTQEQIATMMNLLGVPDAIRTDCGYVVSGREAFCLLLYRLAFPKRLTDRRVLFGVAESCICEAFNYMLHFMDVTWGGVLSLDMDRLVPRLGDFAEALHSWGSPLDNCWGFIDRTVRGIAGQVPNKMWWKQRAFYNGHKRKHAMKFQGVVTPDGIFVDLYGPELGTRHDLYLLSESGLLERLEDNMNDASGDAYCLYGDPAYGMSAYICCPCSESHGPLTEDMRHFNKSMSGCRITVEWLFTEMTSKWAFVTHKPQQKYLLSPVPVQYRMATLLYNIHSCLNGTNQISQFFGVSPPSLKEYLGVV